jgi:aldehyde dehydrogenase (NAD+)
MRSGDPAATIAGEGQSGIGREMGAAGLAEFQESKTFATVVG